MRAIAKICRVQNHLIHRLRENASSDEALEKLRLLAHGNFGHHAAVLGLWGDMLDSRMGAVVERLNAEEKNTFSMAIFRTRTDQFTQLILKNALCDLDWILAPDSTELEVQQALDEIYQEGYELLLGSED